MEKTGGKYENMAQIQTTFFLENLRRTGRRIQKKKKKREDAQAMLKGETNTISNGRNGLGANAGASKFSNCNQIG